MEDFKNQLHEIYSEPKGLKRDCAVRNIITAQPDAKLYSQILSRSID